jgi:hypothetical protein
MGLTKWFGVQQPRKIGPRPRAYRMTTSQFIEQYCRGQKLAAGLSRERLGSQEVMLEGADGATRTMG